MTHQQTVAHIPVHAGLGELGQLAGPFHRPLHLLQFHTRGDGAKLHHHLLGGGRVQRDIQLQPRGQSGSLGQQLAVLGLQGSQLAVGLQDLLHRLFSLLLPVKQLLPGESWAGCQQASSLISVPLEHRQSTLGRLQILPSLGERLPVGPGERLAPQL